MGGACCAVGGAVARGADADFQFVIRPILARNCFACHGPDEGHREADLRLDVREAAVEFGAITPGSPDDSELVRRISSDDPDERMPPADTGKRLSQEEIELIKKWVADGAPYSRHWSYEPPSRPPLPEVPDPAWIKNPIDNFVLSRLDAAGLKPEPQADRPRLLRRLSLDLTGLPPTVEEVDAFVRDERPDAYERVVDRLLASPAYGEHWARKWLDLARYADTVGYEKDASRTIWPYRDWVIDALNSDMPFDQFTIEQLAGDMLPDATTDQIIATAFHRNTMQNDEGGTDDEEFRVAAVIDRVNTTMQVWMGTTMGCCQCHTHKYDPFPHREYYELFAFFNQTADADRYDQEPTLPTPGPDQEKFHNSLKQQLADVKVAYAAAAKAVDAGQRGWEKSIATGVKWHSLKVTAAKSARASKCRIDEEGAVQIPPLQAETDEYSVDGSIELPQVTAIRLETSVDDDAGFTISQLRAVQPATTSSTDAVRYIRVELPDRHDYLALAEVQAFNGEDNVARKGMATQSSTAYDGDALLAIDGRTDPHYATGRSVTHTAFEKGPWWEVDLGKPTPIDRVVLWNRDEFSHRLGRSRVTLFNAERQPVWQQAVHFKPNLSTTLWTNVRPTSPLVRAGADSEQVGTPAHRAIESHDDLRAGWAPQPQAEGDHWLAAAFDAPLVATDGSVQLRVHFRQVRGEKESKGSLRRLRVLATDDPRAKEVAAVPAAIRAIADVEPDQRTAEQAHEIAKYFRSLSPELQKLAGARADVRRRLKEELHLDKTPIMKELPEDQRRETHVFVRGSFLTPGEKVEADTPEVFPEFPADAPRNRLGLARWLVDRRNPLTARVAANRHWEELFGAGLVLTSEDFGSQGMLPSHPELLDWLAVELMDHGWSLKHLAKTIVMSATYRQTSRLSPQKLRVDPENRLLSRGPRHRLSAEQIRDQALFVSGLLSRKMHGPSVMPPQPEGVWQVVYSDERWKTSEGDDRYRRGLYTFWRRTSPYPSAMALDATSRETCTIRRIRTNTPVAAFALLNDPVYVEAAQALARRIMAEGGDDRAGQARFAFRRVLSRNPSKAEVERLTTLFDAQQKNFNNDPEAAKKMATDPLGPAPDGFPLADLAAWTVVSNVLLNLDETLTN
jgi:hypothetical protein